MKSLRQVWAAAQRIPYLSGKNVVSEQTAKQSTIETGLPGNACFQRQNRLTACDKNADGLVLLFTAHVKRKPLTSGGRCDTMFRLSRKNA